jgi:sugar phosphate isomerase/epimerase
MREAGAVGARFMALSSEPLLNPISMHLEKRQQPAANFTRRNFIASTGLATMAALASSPRVCAASRTARHIVVGGHPWVYAATQPGYELTPVLPQIFADMKAAGLDGIELMHTALRPDDAVDRIGALAKQHKLPIIGSSFGAAMWDRQQHAAIAEQAELVIPRLAKLGGRTLGLSVGALKGGAKVRKMQEHFDAQVEMLRRIFALCATHRVTPNLHNHTYEVENDLHDLKGTLSRLPEARLGPDLNWLVRGGVEPAAFIRHYGSKIIFLHLRDQKKDGRWAEAIGEGDMNYPAITAALKETRFQGDAVIELAHERDFKPTRPLRESFRMSREFVRTSFGEITAKSVP